MAEQNGQGDAGEKELDPTPRKLEQARERGDVPRSQEASAAIALILLTCLITWAGPLAGRPLVGAMEKLYSLEALHRLQSGGSFAPIVVEVLARTVLPLLAALAIAGLVLNLAQMGFQLPKDDEGGLKIDLSRLDVVKNARERFGLKALLDSGKNVLKLVLVTAALVVSASEILPKSEAFLWLAPSAMVTAIGGEIAAAVKRIAIIGVVIAVLDYLLEHFRFMRRMRMSRQDVKDELKQTDGDPQIKAARKRRAREIATSKALSSVDQATVLIANPTHFSVTLRYRQSEDLAPIVLGKGKDRIALEMRKRARAAGVPIVENKPLARALYAVGKEGKPIPGNLYRDVAEVLAEVLAPRRRGAAKGARR